jgi:hypothetical protein
VLPQNKSKKQHATFPVHVPPLRKKKAEEETKAQSQALQAGDLHIHGQMSKALVGPKVVYCKNRESVKPTLA